MFSAPKYPKFFIWIAPIILCVLKFSEIVFSPNSYLFNNSGDSLRTYYAFLYYIRFNKSWINFEGMNHPFGEHIMYTDLVAGIAVPLKFLYQIFPFIHGNEMMVFNYTLLISFVLQFVFLYKIGEHYGLKGWVFLFGILALGIISPQVVRLYAHPGLAFVAVIPAAWWMYIQFKTINKIRFAILLSTLLLFALFLHPYLGFIAFSFVLLLAVIEGFSSKNFKAFIRVTFLLILPIIIFNLLVKLTDFHTDRPVRYLDFIYYISDIKIFTAARSLPLFPFYEKINSFFPYEFEKENYFGFLCSVSFITLMVSLLFRQIHFVNLIKTGDTRLIHTFYSSFILAIWAFGIPLVFFIDYLTPDFFVITQFRAVARFIWPLFFVISIVSMIFLTDGIRSHQKLRRFFSYAAFVLLLSEAVFIFEAYKSPQKNPFVDLHTDNSNVSNLPDFIVSVPNFCVGNGAFHKFPTNGIDEISYFVSLQYGIPMMSSVLTRISTPESIKQMSLFSCSACPKPILNDLNSDSDILLILSESFQYSTPISFEKINLKISNPNEFRVYRGQMGNLFRNTAKNFVTFRNNYSEFNEPPVITLFEDTLSLSFRKNYFLKLLFAHEEFKMIADSIKLPHASGLEYEVSYKHSNRLPYQTNLVFVVEEFGEDGSHNWITSVDVSAIAEVEPGTSIIKARFKLTDANKYLRFFLIDYAKMPVTVDISDFQIREINRAEPN